MGNIESNKEQGYLVVWRSFFNGPLWRMKRVYSKPEAFLDILQSAYHSPRTECTGNVSYKVNRGEWPATVRFLAKRWGWSKTKVHNFLDHQKSDKAIKTRTPKGTLQTIITVCNYEHYNALLKESGHQEGQEEDSASTPKETKIIKDIIHEINEIEEREYFTYVDIIKKFGKNFSDELFEIFFFKNFQSPITEIEKFYNHYEACGWVRNSGVKIQSKPAAAKGWEQKPPAPDRFPKKLLKFWEQVYGEMKSRHPGEAIKMLEEVTDLRETDDSVHIYCNRSTAVFLEENIDILRPQMAKHYPQKRVTYMIPNESKL